MHEPLRLGLLADTVDLPGGIGRYVREVLAACAARADIRLTVATTRSGAARVRALAGPALDHIVTTPRDDQLSVALWERHRSGPAFATAGVEVIVGTKHLVPRTRVPTVLVVHDVLTLTRARENARAKRLLLPSQYRHSLTGATTLVAVSAATRARLGRIDARWAAKCTVIPNGMSTDLIEVAPRRPAAVGDGPFALAVGDLSPRKNLALLTSIWAEDPPDLHLVVVGPDAGTDGPARDGLLALEAAGRATWIRGADDAVLRWCYENATVMTFPSFEEGFGLPILEAMSFATPVIAGTDAAVREVAAGSSTVVHLDPTDRVAWRDALQRAAHTAPERPRPMPAVPPHAITWAEHTDRLLACARTLGRGTS